MPKIPKAPAVNTRHIVIRKSRRTLELYDGDNLLRSFRAVLGFTPEGGKQTEGDGRTPEGEYYVFTKNGRSKYHLSLGISYPGALDARRGLIEGSITPEEFDSIADANAAGKMPPQETALGGQIYIHGGGSDDDWTRGCIAMTNEEIGELFSTVNVGTKVIILP